MHLAKLIHDLAIILGVAGLVTLIFQRIRQPVVLGYIIAGIIVGPHTPPYALVTDLSGIQIWAQLGVIFLMFTLGLEFSFRKLAHIGAPAGITACLEALSMTVLGFLCGRLLGWSYMDSLFLGAMLLSSSTTIIIKALDEMGLKHYYFAHIIFGVLIVEDLLVILALVALTALAASNLSGLGLLTAAGQLVLVVGGWLLAGYILVPPFVRYVGNWGNDEMLTIVSSALCLLLVMAATYFGYSVALGAFIMGSILAESRESHHIERLMKPLRDLFAAIFFVSVGMLMDPHALLRHAGPILVITLLAILGKIVTSTLGALVSGQPVKTAVQVGFSLAQIGEFAFIVAGLGQALHVTSNFLFPIGVAVTLVTTFSTPYLIRASGPVADLIERAMPDRLRAFIVGYGAWSAEWRANQRRAVELKRLILRWLLNGLTVTILFVLMAEVILPKVNLMPRHPWITVIGWVCATLVSAPFIWAMLTAFRPLQQEDGAGRMRHGGLLFAFRLLTTLWVGLLSTEFFSAQIALPATIAVAAILFGLFYRQLESWYRWFENRFLATFEEGRTRRKSDALRHLVPWNAHLIRISVHANARMAGKLIRETQLRSYYGLNILAIQRGRQTIVAPAPDERLYPNDELLVLGTDEQAEAARLLIERPEEMVDQIQHISGYALQSVHISKNSPAANRTIRQSEIRERFGAMVVGIERDGQHLLNPDTDEVLLSGDIVWMVGDRRNLSMLSGEWT